MKRKPGKEILLVALGGNALIRKGETGTVEEQFRNLSIEAIAEAVAGRSGTEIVP